MTNPYELRYRNPQVKKPDNIQTNDFLENYFLRKTIRNFDTTRQVSTDQLKYLIAAAQCAPSSSGAASWSVIVLRDKAQKEEFKKLAGAPLSMVDPLNVYAYDNCSVYLIWLMDNYKAEKSINLVANKEISPETFKIMRRRIRESSPALQNLDYDKTPLFDAETHSKHLDENYYTLRAIVDVTIAAQTFCIFAESINLGTMYMGSLAHCNLESFSKILKVPKRTFPIFGMCVGYEHPDGTDPWGNPRQKEILDKINNISDAHVKPIAPIDLMMHEGYYNTDIVEDKLKEFNSTLMNYSCSIDPEKPYDYMVARVVTRISKSDNTMRRMIALGNNFN